MPQISLPPVAQGSRWQCRDSRHAGQCVELTRVTLQTIQFRLIGPGSKRGRGRRTIPRPKFALLFVPL